MCGMIADAADEAAAFYHDIDVGGHESLPVSRSNMAQVKAAIKLSRQAG